MEGQQFSLQRMLIATSWVALGLMVWRWASPFNVRGFLDDDPDNIGPRMLAAFFLIPLAGAVGALQGRTRTWLVRAILAWLLLCIIIAAIGMARLF